MNSAIHDLEYFLVNNASNNSKLLLDIGSFKLGTILSDTVKKLDQMEYLKSCARMAIQKAKNNVFWGEIYNISDVAEKTGIRVIFLKGLFLGRDLYDKEEIRQSTDIDILIDANSILPMLDILHKMGYQPFSKDYGFQPWSSVEQNIDGLKIMKHEEFAKPAIIGGKKALVFLEMHVNMTQAAVAKVDTSGFIERSVARLENGHTFNLLELNDNIFFLLLHFYEHFSVAFNCYCTGKSYEIFNLQNLYDIALLIDEYGSHILWNTIVEHANEAHICIYLALSVYLFNSIYPNRIPDDIFNSLVINGADMSNSAKKLCFKLIKQLTAKEILYNDFEYMMKHMTPSENIKKQFFLCPYITDIKFNNKNGLFIIDEYSEKIDNIYGTYITCGCKPKSSAVGSAKGILFWDIDFLHFYIRVYKQNNIFKGNIEAFSDQDGVELLMADGSSIFYHQLIFTPSVSEYEKVLIINGKTITSINPDIIKCDISKYNDGYELSADIPWCYLDISPAKGKRLRFNIAVNLCDAVTGKRKTRLTWAGKDDNWWDVDWYGELTL